MNEPLTPVHAVNTWVIALVVALGFVGVYLLLPTVRRHPRSVGWFAAAGAVLAAGWLLVRVQYASAETLLFFVFSFFAVVAGGMLVLQRNPVHAALSFAVVVLATCGLFLLQAAPFLMAATTIVYAGAIVVTFLFVIMLAQQEGPSDADYRSREPLFTSVAGFLLLGTLLYVLQLNYDTRAGDALLARIESAQRQDSAAAVDATLDLPRLVEEFPRLAAARADDKARAAADESLLRMQEHWDDWKKANDVPSMRAELAKLDQNTRALLSDHAVGLQPDAYLPLSPFSGAPANTPPRELRRNKQGQVALPATNVESLGLSLLTDYLVPVELAGTLLLVATIGAIAIASRRTEVLR